MPEQPATFGDLLRRYMDGRTNAHIARRCGVRPQTVASWLTGAIPSRDNVETLAEALRLDRDEWLALMSAAGLVVVARAEP